MQTKGVISVIFFIFLRCHFGSALNCYSCGGDCTDKSTATCSQGEKCATTFSYSADGKVLDRRMSCLNAESCTTSQGYSNVVNKCCDKDLCNDPRSESETGANPVAVDNRNHLQCYSCDFLCPSKARITCQNQQQCVIKTATFGGVVYHKRGCVNVTMCNTNTPEDWAGSTVSAKNNCCNRDLCNSAVHLEIPAVTMLAAIVAVWMSKLW